MIETLLNVISPVFSPESFDIDKDEAIVEEVFESAISLNLFMLVYGQLKNVRSAEIIKKYRDSYFSIIARSVKQEVLENKILSVLKLNNIPSLVFKGNALAKDVYQKPNSRSSSDIDILIKLKDIFSADKILKQEGYLALEAEALEFWLTRKHHAVYQCPETNITIEIHWNFCIPGFFNLNSDDIWKNVNLDNQGNVSLNPEMILVQLFIHNSMHAFREFRIFVDILWAMHRYEDTINWSNFAKTLKKTGLLKTAYISINQIIKIWENQIEKIDSIRILFIEIKKQMVFKPLLLSGYFNYDLKKKITYNHKRDQFFVRLTLDSPSMIIKSFVKSFFPSINEIKAFYNDYRAWMLPFNYIRFIGWRISEWIK
jgi:hypothetical protein